MRLALTGYDLGPQQNRKPLDGAHGPTWRRPYGVPAISGSEGVAPALELLFRLRLSGTRSQPGVWAALAALLVWRLGLAV